MFAAKLRLSLGIIGILLLSATFAAAQVAPTGGHYAARPSDTGFAALVNASGGFSQTIALNLAPAKNGLPVPVQVVYGGRKVGAAGMGWDLPLSYIVRDLSYDHRLPRPGLLGMPAAEERLTLVLAGRSMLLVRKGDQSTSTVWVPMRDAPELEVHEEQNGVMRMYDGEGRTYIFGNNGPAGPVGQPPTESHHLYAAGTLYLLQRITTAGNMVALEYASTLPKLPGGAIGLAINLHSVYYNFSPTAENCFHDRILLSYTEPSSIPLSISTINNEVLVRLNTIKQIDVHANGTCTPTPEPLLRRHEFSYDADPDTTLPRLTSVLLYGREGTPEATHPISLGSYTYGTASTGGQLSFTQTGPAFMPSDRLDATLGLSEPITSGGHSVLGTNEILTDLTGDGVPDLFYPRGAGYAIAPNTPGPDQRVTFANVGLADGNVFSAPPKGGDARSTARPFETRTLSKPRYTYDTPAGAFGTIVEDQWRKAIDFNGDGRVDVVDAHEIPGEWVVHLNTPGSSGNPADIHWETRRFAIDALIQMLDRGTLSDDVDIFLPLSRRHTGRNLTLDTCFKYRSSDQKWTLFPEGMSNGLCSTKSQDDPSNLHPSGEITFTEWDVRDLNGDGYPDFVFNVLSPTDSLNDLPNLVNQPPQPPDGTVVPGVRAQAIRSDSFAIIAAYNLLGPHLAQEPLENSPLGTFPFATPTPIWLETPSAPGASTCGLERWITPFELGGHSGSFQDCGFLDVNGDGLPDRIDGSHARLQGGNGVGNHFQQASIELPAPYMARHGNNHSECDGGDADTSSQLISAFRDINGDGIVDWLFINDLNGSWHIQFGTGAGFSAQVLPVAFPFGLSAELEGCSKATSKTVDGLIDINGDGKPDLVKMTGDGYAVFELGGGIPGRPEAGMLVGVDNGQGALINVTYASAKKGNLQPHQVPFPEIVATKVEILRSSIPVRQELAATTFHAFGKSQLIFDSVTNSWTFAGYGRHVQVQATNGVQGIATITDAYLPSSNPATTAQARFSEILQVGRPKDVAILSGAVGCVSSALEVECNPWALLDANILTDDRQIAHMSYSYESRLFQEALPVPQGLFCWDMSFPYDDAASRALGDQTQFEPCLAHGFLFTKIVDSWRGTASPLTLSLDNVRTRIETLSVDDNGNVLSSITSGDGDPSLLIETAYAAPSPPTAGASRVLNAVAKRDVFSYPKPQSGGHFASETWNYDGLPVGSVGSGFPTSHTIARLSASGDDADSLGDTKLTFVYDTAGGALVSATSSRQDQNGIPDGASRTITFADYDEFRLASRITRMEATSGPGAPPIPALVTATDRDPVTLNVLSTTDVNGTVRGTTYDGLGRVVLSTVTSPAESGGFHGSGALSATTYDGFGVGEGGGRRITQTSFADPVEPSSALATAAAGSAPGRTETTFLDELGRVSRTEIKLGSDYADQRLIVGHRSYDKLGRVAVELDPYPSSQEPGSVYRTTWFFNTDGTPHCQIRGSGVQAFTDVTDEANEVYPTCFTRTFSFHREVLSMQRPDALMPSAPNHQAGVTQSITKTAGGQTQSNSTWQNGTRLEYAEYEYDTLGRLNAMHRFKDPANVAGAITTRWQFDATGNMLQFDEPESAQRTRKYSNWGELTDEQWTDTTVSPAVTHHVTRRYDGLGRLRHGEEQLNGVVDPETVNDYQYDEPVAVTDAVAWSAGNTLGRMTLATSPTGGVAFDYDSLGRVSSKLFTDEQLGLYVENSFYHGDGSISAIDLFMPDNLDAVAAAAPKRRDERVQYDYDSAGRVRGIGYADGLTSQNLFEATSIDAFGRIRAAQYGNTSYTASYADVGRRLIENWSISSSVGGQLHSRQVSFLPVTPDDFRPFDPLGRERGRVEVVDGMVSATTKHVNDYDPLGRLQGTRRTTGGDVQERAFSYDALGNVFNLSNFAQPQEPSNAFLTYASTDGDRFTRVQYGTGSDTDVSYDGVGNVVRMHTSAGTTRTLDYLAGGEVRKISDDAGNSAHFRYDAFGGLQGLDVESPNAAKTRRDRHVGDLITVRDEIVAGTLQQVITRTIPGPGGFVATRHGAAASGVAETSGQWIFGFGENRGSRYFTNEQGQFVQDVTYEPFGAVASNRDANGSEFSELRLREYSNAQWNGGDAVDALGVTMLGARVYDPIIGRFLSRDPLLVPRTAATTNPYAFAMNDPINLSDPSGLDADPNTYSCGLLCLANSGSNSPGTVAWLSGAAMVAVDLFQLLNGGRGPTGGLGGPAPADPGRPQTVRGTLLWGSAIASGYNPPVSFNFDSLAANGATLASLSTALEQTQDYVDTYNEQYALRNYLLGVGSRGSVMLGRYVAGRLLPGIGPLYVSYLATLNTPDVDVWDENPQRLGDVDPTSVPGPSLPALPTPRSGPPNPDGSRGGPAHRDTIDRRIQELQAEGHQHLKGGSKPEAVIPTPGGSKSYRRPDITTRAPDGSIYNENVGRSIKSGAPVAREVRALDDIEASTGRRPGYTPYDR